MHLLKITPVGADAIGKQLRLAEGRLAGSAPAFPEVARAERVQFASMGAVLEFLQQHRAQHWAAVYALPAGSGPWACLEGWALDDPVQARRRLEHTGLEHLPRTARTNAQLHYQAGMMLVSVDYDPPEDPLTGEVLVGHPWTPAEVWAALVRAEPLLGAVDHVEIPYSASSFIRGPDGLWLRERGGCRVMFPMLLPNASGPRATMAAIFDRLCMMGECWPFMDKRGTVSLRTVIDMALYRAAQPDFLGAPMLGPGLTRDCPPITLVPGTGGPDAMLDARQVLALSGLERQQVTARLREAQLRLEQAGQDRREDWHRARDEELLAHDPTADRAQARARRTHALDGGLSGGRRLLPVDFMIHVDRIGWRSVAEIVANPQEFAGRGTSSPLEPDYPVGNGQPQPGRGKLVMASGEMNCIDYAHGAFTMYTLAGSNAEFDALINVPDAGAAAGSGIQQAAARLGSADADDLEQDDLEQHDELELQHDALVVLPLVPPERFAREAVRSMAARTITAAAGLDLQRALIRHWLQQAGGAQGALAVGVPDYADAARLKAAAQAARPDARVMVMPGRSTDAVRARERHGVRIFEFVDPATGQAAGLSDELCPKRALVSGLMEIGKKTVAGLTCISVKPQRVECPHLRSCGYVARLNARSAADVVIYTHSGLQGEDNPLLGPALKDLTTAGTLLLDPVTRPASDRWFWRLATWRAVPALRQVLDLAAANEGWAPRRLPDGLMDAVQAWAGGLGGITPDLDAQAALRIVEDYRVRAGLLVGDNEPLPVVVSRCVEQWAEGGAMIRAGERQVEVFMHEPPRRLQGQRALVATTCAPRLSLAASRGSIVQLSDQQPVDPVLGTLLLGDGLVQDAPADPQGEQHLVVRASSTLLPSRVVQVAEDRLATWLNDVLPDKEQRKRGQGDRGPRLARDVVHLAKLLCTASGPGIIVSDQPTELSRLFESFGEQHTVARHMTFAACSMGTFLVPDEELRARWAIVIGRAPVMAENGLLRAAMDMHPDQWAEGIPGLGQAIRGKTRALYGFRDGSFAAAPKHMKATWRHAGMTALLDEMLMAGVAAPVSLLANHLACLEREDKAPRLLAVVSKFPLASQNNPSAGVLIDDLRDWTAVPPASLVLQEIAAMTSHEAVAKHLRVDEGRVRQELSSGWVGSLDYWRVPLAHQPDASSVEAVPTRNE